MASAEETRHIDLTIVMPEDNDRVEQLRKKLEEYRSRLDPYHHPDLEVRINPDTVYKVMILEKMLDEGTVSSFAIAKEVVEKYGFLEGDIFSSCCGVINDYVMTGGATVSGGIGLPTI